MDRIFQGDARETLATLPSESIHLAVTSPPYNLGIAYAGYSDDRAYEEYLEWLGGVWAELKRVLVVQAAMPSGVSSILIARLYGGQPIVAVQIILGTTILALFTIPLWIHLGFSWVGLSP